MKIKITNKNGWKNIKPGDTIEVNDIVGERLVERGTASKAITSAPKNKMIRKAKKTKKE